MGYNRYRNNNQENYQGQRPCPEEKRHVHEVQGSVKIAGEDPHTHRFCTVSGEAIPYGTHDHVHEVCFRTDTYDDHCHEFKGRTGCAVPVGGDRHVHYIESVTTVDDGHRHRFEAATLIENPTGVDRRKDDRHDCDCRDNKY